MKKANIATTTYEVGDGFMVDIVELPDTFEAWLYHKQYGVKDLMLSSPKQHRRFGKVYTKPLEDFLKLVEANVEDYIGGHEEEHMD